MNISEKTTQEAREFLIQLHNETNLWTVGMVIKIVCPNCGRYFQKTVTASKPLPPNSFVCSDCGSGVRDE